MSITPGQISATNSNIKKSDRVLISTANISYVNDWTGLSALEPSYYGKECIINSISGSSVFLRTLAHRGISAWVIPGSDTNTISYLTSNPIPAIPPPLIPPPLRLSVIDGSQDFQSPLNNDGNLWFWAGGGVGTFHADIKNIEDDNYEYVELQIESVADPISPVVGVGFSVGGSVIADTNIVQVISGGSNNSPKIGMSSKLRLPTPVSPNNYFHMAVAQTSGVVTLAKTFSQNVWPQSGQIGNDYFVTGNSISSNPGGGVLGIGPGPSRLYCYLPTTATPRVIWEAFGDSTVAQVRPVAATNNSAKEGVWHFMNEAAKNASKGVRVYSRGNGGMDWTGIKARVRANLPSMVGRVNGVLVQVWTWNTPWADVGQANTAWSEWLVLKSDIESYGFVAKPLILLPYTTRNSVGQIAAWQALYNNTVSAGGLVLNDLVSSNGADIDSGYSEDNVHLNASGAYNQATNGVSRLYTFTNNAGWSI